MTALVHPAHFTADDVLRLESEGLFEVVGGRLVEKEMGALASETAIIVSSRLLDFVRKARLGSLYSELTFRCFPHDPDLIRRPDLAFIAANRVKDVPEEGHVPIRPDLAVEIVSPNDRVYDFDEKLEDYHRAGIPMVWVINPKLRTLRVYRLDKSVTVMQENDLLSGESVLRGFSILVKELLPPISQPGAS